ncbi:MAG: hypothetical protein K5751_03805 [Treponemataceae bacterium]|nr:hypothetical protein [Treponemataceae bacterium]
MKKTFKTFLIICIILLFLIGLLFFVYRAKSFYGYNQLVDRIISSVAGLFGNHAEIDVSESNSSEDFCEFADIDFSNFPDIDVSQKNPVFSGKFYGLISNLLDDSETETTTSLSDTGLPLFKISDFELKAKNFLYDSEWKYIVEPFLFGKYLAVFTGEPGLQIFSLSSGMIYECEVPVYPDKILYFNENSLIFSGRDGEKYYFSFTGEPLFATNPGEVRISPKESFYPDEKCAAAIKSRLDMWTDKKIDKLPPVSFFATGSGTAGTSAVYDNETGLSIYAYSPTEQGKYKVGFADEKGTWSNCSAFVFVFLQDGEMLSMSFEYYADKPQVEVNLSDREIYYFVCGAMNDSEIPENTRIAVRGL